MAQQALTWGSTAGVSRKGPRMGKSIELMLAEGLQKIDRVAES
jgi:hypothetical protein